MRPVEYTTEQIIQAGHELEATGRTVTGFAIRQKLGGGTQARLRQVWEEHLAATRSSQVAPALELPAEVAEVVTTIGKNLSDRLCSLAFELNDKAVKAAKREVQEVVRTAGEQRELAERELADAGQTIEDLEGQLDQVRNDLAALQEEFAELQNRHQAQAVDLAQIKERLAMVDQAAKQQKDSLVAAQHERDIALENLHKLQGQYEATQAQVTDLMKALSVPSIAKSAARKDKH